MLKYTRFRCHLSSRINITFDADGHYLHCKHDVIIWYFTSHRWRKQGAHSPLPSPPPPNQLEVGVVPPPPLPPSRSMLINTVYRIQCLNCSLLFITTRQPIQAILIVKYSSKIKKNMYGLNFPHPWMSSVPPPNSHCLPPPMQHANACTSANTCSCIILHHL